MSRSPRRTGSSRSRTNRSPAPTSYLETEHEMSKEIVEAVRGLAAEKNISQDKLMEALEDALLSAYKKTPGSAPYAKVQMDRESGDFIVWELKIPPELEEQLLIAATDEQPTVDPETGEMRDAPEPE